MHRVITVLVLMLFATATLTHSEVKKLVRVDLSNQSEAKILDFMRLHPDVTFYGREGRLVDVVAPLSHLEAYRNLGFPIEVQIEDVDEYTQALKQQGYFDHFHDYDRALAEMQAVEAAHPEIAQLYDIGDGWEKTQGLADRDIWAIKISDNVTTEEADEPEVLYMACHHAREIITPEIVLYFMNYLVDNYGSDPEVTDIVNNRQLWLIPLVNPDGHAVVFTGTDWRKNKRDNNGNGQFDLSTDGVDLNRNYGFAWGYDNIGSSPDPANWLYRGPSPFSEPETQVIRDFVEAHSFVISLSYHSYSNLWLYPWAYRAQNTPDHEIFVEIADSCVAYNGYEPGNTLSGTIYVVNGETDDWMYGEQTTKCKTYAFTPEVGGPADGFYPDTSRRIPLILENLGPNLYVARAAEKYTQPAISYLGFSLEEVSGNGDGILDPGEMVNLFIRIENKGLGGVSEISVVLETADTDVTISHSEVTYPGMGCSALAENSEDPFTISVSDEAQPHGIVFSLHLSEIEGTYQEDVTFQLLIGQGTVLLVADDGGLDNENYYIDAFQHLGIPYEILDVHGMSKPPSNVLFDYSEVIWFTGSSEQNTLTPEDQSDLAAYLNNGGRLLLSGSMIGYEIGTTPFYRNYLHARFVSFLTLLHHLNGTPTNPIGGGMNIALASGGSNGQGFAGETDPISPAVSVFNYDRSTEEGPGIVSSSGSGVLAVETAEYKVVYASFGLEGIEPLEDRVQVLADVLAWFKKPGVDKGDVDGNGTTDIIDAVMAVNIVLGLHQPEEDEIARADMNYDGAIDIIDVVNVVNAVLG
ncbi:MAG: hypothetical protein JSV84_09335 [Gemmatimonadota bacterium]|nr:MAG: hypothetical protein JSV84_09335 [Gemmatimonadota bacterium]